MFGDLTGAGLLFALKPSGGPLRGPPPAMKLCDFRLAATASANEGEAAESQEGQACRFRDCRAQACQLSRREEAGQVAKLGWREAPEAVLFMREPDVEIGAIDEATAIKISLFIGIGADTEMGEPDVEVGSIDDAAAVGVADQGLVDVDEAGVVVGVEDVGFFAGGGGGDGRDAEAADAGAADAAGVLQDFVIAFAGARVDEVEGAAADGESAGSGDVDQVAAAAGVGCDEVEGEGGVGIGGEAADGEGSGAGTGKADDAGSDSVVARAGGCDGAADGAVTAEGSAVHRDRIDAASGGAGDDEACLWR